MPPTRTQHPSDIALEFNETRARAYKAATSASLQRTIESANSPLSVASRDVVTATLNRSASDPLGDGDQSPVPPLSVRGKLQIERLSAPLRSAWATGLDLHLCLIPANPPLFHHDCYHADIPAVLRKIDLAKQQVAQGHDTALTTLLETRISMLRLTPLHMTCQAARMHGSENIEGVTKYYNIAQILLENGARPDSRDICGYPPMSNAAAFQSTPESRAIVPLLKTFGADPNVVTRFGEGLLVPPLVSGNIPAFRALIQVGADVNLEDRHGLTPRHMAMSSQALMSEILDGQRQHLLKMMKCDQCGKPGARKHCAACKKAYYCSRPCQVKDWKSGHKQLCGKQTDYVDIVVGVMTTTEIAPGLPAPAFMNTITGKASKKTMKKKKKDDGKAFVVKVARPMGDWACVKINRKNSDWLLVKSGEDEHRRLMREVGTRGIDQTKMYLSAKWVEGREVDGVVRDVLRIDLSKALPPPKPVW